MLQVVLMFPYIFWDDTKEMFGRVVDSQRDRGDFYLFYSYAHISGGALLVALVAGSAAVRLEEEPAGQAVARVMEAIRRIHEPQNIEVPAPIQVRARGYVIYGASVYDISDYLIAPFRIARSSDRWNF